MKPLVLRVSPKHLPGDLDALLSRADRRLARDSDSVVYRLPNIDWFTKNRDAILENKELLRRRSLRKPLLLAGYDEKINQVYSVNLSDSGQGIEPVSDSIAKEIRAADLRQVFSAVENDSHLAAGPGLHFITPSGYHCSHFVRFADMVQSSESLDTFAYWLSPYMKEHSGVLADSWGTVSAVLASMIRAGVSLPIECFSAHPNHSPDDARQVVARLLQKLPQDSKLLIVCGISGSGELIAQAKSLIADSDRSGSITVTEVSIYSYPTAAVAETFYQLSELGISYQTASDCEPCKNQHKTVRVHPGRFIVTEVSEDELGLPPTLMAPAKSFLDKFNLDGVLRVHSQDSFNHERHHAFDIEIENLVSQGVFGHDLNAAIKEVGSIDIIIVPNHAAGKAMATICAKQLACETIYDDVEHGFDAIEQGRSRLANCKRILVLDDVITTGDTLRSINNRLRESCTSIDSVNYLVAVDRSESAKVSQEIRNGLIQHHKGQHNTFTALYTLHLPNLDKEQCPWCHEYRVLTEITYPLLDPPKWLTARQQMLVDRDGGIQSDPFLLLDGMVNPALGAKSELANKGATAMNVLFRIASGLQKLRNHEESSKRLLSSIFRRQVLAPRVVTENYTEPLVRACLMRCVRGEEWAENGQSRIASTFSNSAIRGGRMLAFMPEVMLAVARGELRGFQKSQWERLMGKGHEYSLQTLMPLVAVRYKTE